MTEDPRDEEMRQLRERVQQLEAAKPKPAPLLPAQPPVPNTNRGCIIGVIGFIAVSILMLIAISNSHPPPPGSTPPGSTSAYTPPAAPTHEWLAADYQDTLTSHMVHESCITSSNEVNLHFPYHDQTGDLCVRQGRHGTEAYVRFSDHAQIVCSVSECGVPVAIDGHVQRFSGLMPSDYSSQVLFLAPGPRMAGAATRAHRIIVRLDFYQDGSQELIFEPAHPLVLNRSGHH